MKTDLHRCRRQIIVLGILALAWAEVAPCLHANPTGGTVAQGAATFSSSGSQFTINQSSPSAFINWGTFNIGAGETTTFNQPSASSITWNQINDSNPSQILGNLNANGYVVLQNANGFYIGGQAAITAHGLIMTTASTPALDLSSSGPWSFNTPPPTAKIINYGKINITGGGPAFLIANDIVNHGEVSAPGGKIGLYAGQTVLVSTSPDGRGLSAKVTLPQGSVDNEGHLIADGGSIAAQARMVNQNGLVQANSAQNVSGTIELVASDSLNLGASSQISATGDPAATGPSSGGTVTIKSDRSLSDQTGSTMDIAGGTTGGNGGQLEISAPQMSGINSGINGQAAVGFDGGILTIDPLNIWLAAADNDPTAPSGYSVVNVNSFSGFSQINLQADNNIALNTLWNLADAATLSILSLSAGNNITLNLNSAINAGKNWNVNLTAGTGFVPNANQPKPSSGSDGIYLYGSSIPSFSSYIRTQNGDINLWAANEVQLGWSGTAALPGVVNPWSGGVTTKAGGSINVATVYGDVNSSSSSSGFVYQTPAPYYAVDPNLGGISTAAGGDVTIAAGGDVISYLPSGSTSVAAGDAGTGAFGLLPGNVTINAGGNVYGHYVLTDGTGSITAGKDVGAATGKPFALSLASGGWEVNAPNGNIYLQEVRNPNGTFNNKTSRFGNSFGKYLFTYAPQAYVDLQANGVYLTSLNVPRPYGAVPVLYPPVLNISAGSGGVTLQGNVTLFPSPDQNLSILTTDGGNFSAAASLTSPYQLMMSDSALSQWVNAGSFGNLDHGGLQNEPGDSSPVVITVAGDMENLNLITTKATEITVKGDMKNCGFSGQNLQAGDHTTIRVGGQIFNTSPYSFVYLSDAIPAVPVANLLTGMGNSWDDVFTLAVDPAILATLASQISQYFPPSQWTSEALLGASLFGDHMVNGQLAGGNPGFVYDPATGRLGFSGPMTASVVSALTQPITVLHLVNGQAVIDTNPNDHSPGRTYGQFETDAISWANPSVVQTLFAASQGNPSLKTVQLGYQIGGPGYFDIQAGSISLGNSSGILSCGVYDAQGGFNRYGNLTSITPSGSTINVTTKGDLDMLTSTIAALGGGDVNVTSTGGSMDLGSAELFNSHSAHSIVANAHLAFGIYTSGGGNVHVNALGNVDINGSRIATYNGGDIFIESQEGDVNVGSGTADLNHIYVSYINPVTVLAGNYDETVYGSGIVANTLVPAQGGETFPPHAATLPGDITIRTPQGDIISTKGGILQAALDGTITAGPTVTLEAGTPQGGDWSSSANPVYLGNINLGQSGVIGGTVTLRSTGDIIGQVVSRQNSTVNAGQNFSGTLLSGGSAAVSGGGTVSGTIIGVGGANVSGGSGVSATVLGQNVSVNGGAATSTLGSSATATSATASAAAQASNQNEQSVAANGGQDSDDDKKKKKGGLVRTVGRVTVILSSAVPSQ